MATVRWRGDALAVAQVSTFTVSGTWAADDTVTLTMGNKAVVVTLGATSAASVAAVVAALVAAWNGDAVTTDETRSTTGDLIPEFDEVTASGSTSPVTLTADTAGKPFTVTVDRVTGDSGAVGSVTEATASAGPNHWDTAANWDTGSVPVGSDAVYVENSSVDILYGLDQNAVTLASLNVAASYTGRIGLADYDEAGSYYQYRDKYLKISATLLKVGYGPGAGSQRIKINVGSNACTATIEGTAAGAETGLPALLFLGTHASNVLNASEGEIGVAVEAGQVSTVATVRCGYERSIASDVRMRLGSGCTLTTINQSGGDLEINSACTTITRTGGTLTRKGSGAVTTVNDLGGTLYDQGTGTVTTMNVGSGGTLDRTQTMLGCTYTTTNLYKGATLLDPFQTLTFTNPFTLTRCSLADVTLDLGDNFSLQRS